jgi:sortase A
MAMKGRIGIILILAGLIIISSAIWMRASTEQKEKAMMEEFSAVIEASESSDAAQQINAPSDVQPAAKVPENMIGIMSIPKIDLSVPLVDGIDEASLKYAVGHFKDTPMPGDAGNCAVAGHRSYTYNQYFNRLYELEPGDIISVKTRQGQFQYKVFEKKIVEPTDLDVLKNTGDSIITLITCHPERSSAYRLIVKGRLE